MGELDSFLTGFDFNTDTTSANIDAAGLSNYNLSPGGYSQSIGFVADYREAMKLDAFVPRVVNDTRPWWERVAEYGMTRAIDANFGPAPTDKTGAAATFAGQNGKTYTQNPNNRNGGAVGSDGGFSPLLLIGIAALALLF